MESPESMTLTFYISSAICAQADFDFLTCSLFFSIPAGKFPWNDERSVHRDFIYNTCGTLVMTVIHSTNQDGVDWVATKAQISYSILSFWTCCSSLKFRAFLQFTSIRLVYCNLNKYESKLGSIKKISLGTRLKIAARKETEVSLLRSS